MKINKAIEHTQVAFHGYDGKMYLAFVARVRKGIAQLNYYAYVGGLNRQQITAYIEDATRISDPHVAGLLFDNIINGSAKTVR